MLENTPRYRSANSKKTSGNQKIRAMKKCMVGEIKKRKNIACRTVTGNFSIK
jgi:hypothetical protein